MNVLRGRLSWWRARDGRVWWVHTMTEWKSHNLESGCCFQGSRENQGCRNPTPPSTLPLPPHPIFLSTPTLHRLNLGRGGVLVRLFRDGWGCCRQGGQEWELCGWWWWCVCVCRGGVYTNSGNSLHKPVHSKDVPFNLHWAARALTQCGAHCGSHNGLEADVHKYVPRWQRAYYVYHRGQLALCCVPLKQLF